MRIHYPARDTTKRKTLDDLKRGDCFLYDEKHFYMKIDLKCDGLTAAFSTSKVTVMNLRYGSVRLLPKDTIVKEVLDGEIDLFNKE